MRRSPRPDGRMTLISPAFSTKNGTSVWPPSINTSPQVAGRVTPWEAIRAICADVSVRNRSAAYGALVSGSDGMGSVNTSRTSDGLWERNVNMPDVAIDGHRVRLE